jgi:hypothetical protein
MASIVVLLAVAAVGQAFAGQPAPAAGAAETPSPAAPTIVVAGAFVCQLVAYPIYPQARPDEPIEYVHRLMTSIGFSATGGVVVPAPAGPPGRAGVGTFVGPGIVGAPVSLIPSPVVGGAGVGNTFDAGTLDDCRQFAETVRAAAQRLRCTTSRVAVTTPIQYYGGGAQIGLVCEGPADEAIHAIADLDRVVLALEPATRE